MGARATQDSFDLGWSDPPLADTVQSSEQTAVPLDTTDEDEPTRVAASATAVVVPPVHAAIEATPAIRADGDALEASALGAEALDGSEIPEDGARLTEPGLAPPPPTSAEIAAAEAIATVHETAPTEADPPAMVPTPPASMPAASIPQPPASMPAASVPPPPIQPAIFAPASLAPTAVDYDEFASPSLLATMKRTRPTSAWTGVGLFIAALTFAGGIGIGRSMSPPLLPPVPVPAPLPASVAAESLSPTSTPAATTEPPVPVASSKPPAPFDAKAARVALDDAANAAKTCRATGDPKGTITTTVTFGPSGQVANVAIKSSRYAGTKTARCIADRLSQTRVSEFSGFPESLKTFVTVR